ncbi:MAG: choice-of-anchor J domain-containing protein, partial [Calditrichia bacterium]
VNFTGGGTVLPEADTSFWFSNFNNANPAGLIDEWLISPRLPLIESGDTLHFYAGAIAGNFDDSLKVWISTTDSLPGSFTQIGYFKVEGPVGAWNRYSFDLSAFAGSQVFVAVNYYIVDGGPTGAHSDNVWVDHFILENSGTTGISDIGGTIDDFSLSQNYPNPFNPSTTIEYFLKEKANVNLAVYNILGEKIINLVRATQAPGSHSVVWNGKDKMGKEVAGGIYFYKLKAGDFEQTRRMLLLK